MIKGIGESESRSEISFVLCMRLEPNMDLYWLRFEAQLASKEIGSWHQWSCFSITSSFRNHLLHKIHDRP